MIPEKEVKFFIRFLKEKGLFAAFQRDHSISANKHFKKPLKIEIKTGQCGRSKEFLMDCILWRASKFRYWDEIYHVYKKHYNENFK